MIAPTPAIISHRSGFVFREQRTSLDIATLCIPIPSITHTLNVVIPGLGNRLALHPLQATRRIIGDDDDSPDAVEKPLPLVGQIPLKIQKEGYDGKFAESAGDNVDVEENPLPANCVDEITVAEPVLMQPGTIVDADSVHNIDYQAYSLDGCIYQHFVEGPKTDS